jgi:hypothetical protein
MESYSPDGALKMTSEEPNYVEIAEQMNKVDRERFERGAQLVDLFVNLITGFKPTTDEMIVAGVFADLAMYCEHNKIDIDYSLQLASEFHHYRKFEQECVKMMIKQQNK